MYRKVKFSLEFKKECLDLIALDNDSIVSISRKKGVSSRLLSRWKLIYEQKGIQGLIPKKTRSYPASFKLGVLEYVSNTGISVDQACVDFNIGSCASIINWQKQYKDLGFVGLQNKPKGRPSIMKHKLTTKKTKKSLTREQELLEENTSLRAELDYLKKLEALIQAKKTREKRL